MIVLQRETNAVSDTWNVIRLRYHQGTGITLYLINNRYLDMKNRLALYLLRTKLHCNASLLEFSGLFT